MNFFNKLSLGSKILSSLLFATLLSILLTGYIGYSSGKNGLTSSVFNQLTGLRNLQAQSLATDFDRTQNLVLTLSESPMVINAIKAFKAAIAKLSPEKLTSQQRQKLVGFYEKSYIPALAKTIAGIPTAQSYLPVSSVEQYLQYHYIAANPNPIGKKMQLDFAKDGSEYSSVHRKVHPKFRNIIQRIGYYDLFLVDRDTGQVLYSTSKEVDFASNSKFKR